MSMQGFQNYEIKSIIKTDCHTDYPFMLNFTTMKPVNTELQKKWFVNDISTGKKNF